MCFVFIKNGEIRLKGTLSGFILMITKHIKLFSTNQVQEVRVAKALNKEFIEFHGDEIHGSK